MKKTSKKTPKKTPAKFPKKIGVIHLAPLPFSPSRISQPIVSVVNEVGRRAIEEAKILERAGFDALIIENFGDSPFFKSRVPRITIASMAIIAAAVKGSVKVPVGINVLRNDSRTALAIAAASGCDFIRVNILSGVTATDQGVIEGQASILLRERAILGAENVKIYADVDVKHGKSISSMSLEDAVDEAVNRAGADAVIVTGTGTGKETNQSDFKRILNAAKSLSVPVFVGSGVTVENISDFKYPSSGIIVGSALRVGGKAGAKLDPKRTKSFILAAKKPMRKTKPKKSKSISARGLN